MILVILLEMHIVEKYDKWTLLNDLDHLCLLRVFWFYSYIFLPVYKKSVLGMTLKGLERDPNNPTKVSKN